MGVLEIGILSTGLAMDAAAVSMTNGMVYTNLKVMDYVRMSILFGIFQGVMPLFGFFTGTIFAGLITKYSGIVIFVILGTVGGNMIRESFVNRYEKKYKDLTVYILLLQAIATSIDAFAIGIGFCAARVEIVPAVCIIAGVTAGMVICAAMIGEKFGDIFESKAELLGGVILVIIGVKALM